MTGFVNAPETMRAESLRGFAKTHAGLVTLDERVRYLRRRVPKRGKVALVSGGGSGHEPMHIGFVGEGMLDAACPGEIFTAPTPDQIIAAIEAVDAGRGVLLIVKNYDGDVMNFAMAAEMTTVRIETVIVNDDVSIDVPERRRGVAGTLVVEKIVGAAAERGDDLMGLKALADRVVSRIRTMGVALRPCEAPGAGMPNFRLEADEIEMGVGIHGEAGCERVTRMPADDIVARLIASILADLRPSPGEEALLLVNGFGATPPAELYLVMNAAAAALEGAGIRPTRFLVGSYATSLDMAGCSLTIGMLDIQLRQLWDCPVDTAVLRWLAAC